MIQPADLIRDEDLRKQLVDYDRGQTLGRPGSRLVFVDQLAQLQKQRDEEQTRIAALPPMQQRRAIIRGVIESQGPAPENLRYMPTPLAICGLPYKAPAAGEFEFERKQGRMGVVVTAGKLRAPDGRRVQQQLPWGPKARLIMAHLSTEALRNRSRIIETSETLSGFMRDMGFTPRGGPRGNIEPFKEQLRALAACRMEISAWDGKRSGTVDVKPLDKVELWFSDHPDQQTLWPTQVAFSQPFYDELQKHALPIDVRVLRALSNSARRLDLMFWVTYRITRLQTHLILDWRPLKEQFGQGYARDRAFREAFKEDVAAIKELFPKLPLKLTERGLEMDQVDATALSIPRRIAS